MTKSGANRVPVTMYGIPNCDTVKKARTWLDANGVTYAFHDYKRLGIDRAHLEKWCREHGWEALCNRAGTTFRKLPDAEKAGLNDARAIALMSANPSMIKRPVVEIGDDMLVGFAPDTYAARFKA